MIGRTLLHYTVVEKLGEGGMGVVYKARDTRLNRFVVLKVLQSESLGDQDRNRRFFQEAQAASALNHPNIITIHDMAVDAGIAFIVMEYVQGYPLYQLIAPAGMPVDETLHYAIQIADGLSAAHSAGVIHRDLKPANIMVTSSGLVKLLDFGLAKLTPAWQGSGAAHVATVAGSIVGTLSYMSPEQAMGRQLDARSDLFSLGSVLYEMVTGRRAFGSGDASPLASLTAVLRDTPLAPAAVNPAVPSAIDRLIMRLLEKDPERRHASAAELKAELLRIKGTPISNPPGVTAPASMPAAVPLATPKPESSILVEGRQALKLWTAAALARAKECFEQALRTDQNHGTVYACMSEYYSTSAMLGIREPLEAMPKAEWAARKALELDANCEQAQVTLGIVTGYFNFRWQEAAGHYTRAQSPESRLRYAMTYLRPLGMFAEAESLLQGNELALAWLELERGSAEAAAGRAARSGQQHWVAAWIFAWTLLERGSTKDAIEICQRGLQIEPGQPYLESALATAFARHGQPDVARQMLLQNKPMPAWYSLPVHAALGETDAAFASAQHAVRRKDAGVITNLRLPGSGVVRLGARFGELVRELGLDGPHTTSAAR